MHSVRRRRFFATLSEPCGISHQRRGAQDQWLGCSYYRLMPIRLHTNICYGSWLCENHRAGSSGARLIRERCRLRMNDSPRPHIRFSCFALTTASSVFTQPGSDSDDQRVWDRSGPPPTPDLPSRRRFVRNCHTRSSLQIGCNEDMITLIAAPASWHLFLRWLCLPK